MNILCKLGLHKWHPVGKPILVPSSLFPLEFQDQVYNVVCLKCGKYRPDGDRLKTVRSEVVREILAERRAKRERAEELARKAGWNG